MFCIQCHKEIEAGVKFCPHCGQEQPFNPFANSTPNSSTKKKRPILTISMVAAIVILALIIQQSNWYTVTFGERHIVSGIATNYIQVGKGIEENTYLVLASVDGGEQQYVAVQTMVPLDYYIQATCVEAGRVNLFFATGSGEYPLYIQVIE